MRKLLKNNSVKKFNLFFMALGAMVISSCSNDDADTVGDETARLSVRMTDAPGDYQAVFVDVQDVMIQTEATAEDEAEWESVGNVNTGVYDLLKLTGGVDVLLADNEIPAGYLGQIRLVLGDDNSLVTNDGETQPLSTPSAQQSGLKLQVNKELEAGEEYFYLMDFDVEESIVTAGTSGGFILKPVIRLSVEEEAATITGEVHPTSYQTLVEAENGGTKISSYTDSEGNFMLRGVPAGTYRVTVTPDEDSGWEPVVKSNIEVAEDATVDLETIFLDQE